MLGDCATLMGRLTLLYLTATLLATPELPVINAPEVIVTIAPSTHDEYQLLKRKTPDTYTCKVMVRDAETRAAALHAELVLVANQSDREVRKFGEYTLDFAVTMKGKTAQAEVTVKRGDKMLTRQRSTVSLDSQPGIIPIR